MLLPHILVSVLVAVRSISTIVYESVRFASSEMVSRNFATLALLAFVLSSVIPIPPWMSRHCVQLSFFANTRGLENGQAARPLHDCNTVALTPNIGQAP